MLTKRLEGSTITYTAGTETVLTVEETVTDTGVRITFDGQLRSDVANDLQDELIAFITGGVRVRVDMEKVTYIANGVQEVLVSVQQCAESMGIGALTLCNLPEPIVAEFESTGIIDCLDVEF